MYNMFEFVFVYEYICMNMHICNFLYEKIIGINNMKYYGHLVDV